MDTPGSMSLRQHRELSMSLAVSTCSSDAAVCGYDSFALLTDGGSPNAKRAAFKTEGQFASVSHTDAIQTRLTSTTPADRWEVWLDSDVCSGGGCGFSGQKTLSAGTKNNALN